LQSYDNHSTNRRFGKSTFSVCCGPFFVGTLRSSLKYDISHYNNNNRRRYLIDKFSVSGEIATIKEIEQLKPENIFNKIIGKVFGLQNKYIFYKHVFNEPEFAFL